MKKIIFLDIDGVLNSQELADKVGWGGHFTEDVDPTRDNVLWGEDMVKRLRRIVEETGSQIVMSSTWRIYFSVKRFKEMFALYGWDAPIIDRTPGGYKSRGREINRWLVDKFEDDEHTVVSNYVIIDDFHDFMPQQEINFVQTNPEIGLTDKDADRAIEILNRKYELQST